jgi:hypothetical protein
LEYAPARGGFRLVGGVEVQVFVNGGGVGVLDFADMGGEGVCGLGSGGVEGCELLTGVGVRDLWSIEL